MLLVATAIDFPTNIASVNLVMGCPNARAGAQIVKKLPLEKPKISTPSLATATVMSESGVVVCCVALVVPILVGFSSAY